MLGLRPCCMVCYQARAVVEERHIAVELVRTVAGVTRTFPGVVHNVVKPPQMVVKVHHIAAHIVAKWIPSDLPAASLALDHTVDPLARASKLPARVACKPERLQHILTRR